MRTRKIVRIRLRRNARARKAQKIREIKLFIMSCFFWTTLLVYGIMTAPTLNP